MTLNHLNILQDHPYHGIALPLFSLRSKNDLGVGDFFDLLPLIDWCKKINFHIIQLLPINDTGEDPSPYNPISSCALDPIYISLKKLPIDSPSGVYPKFNKAKVWKKKSQLLYDYYLKEKNSLKDDKSFEDFQKENGWLKSYSKYKTKLDGKEAEFYIFLQYVAFDQLKSVKKHAEKQGILLKGDIPILISPNSVDVLESPKLFHLDLEAGAPPDYINSEGQCWGFPLFNWEEMKKEGYQWWKQRLKIIEPFFHIYRIDHIVGFFRIWGMLRGELSEKGWFIPTDQHLWGQVGEERLNMFLQTSPLLAIGEDLGVIPEEVPRIMKKLHIPGTKVIRWQRDWEHSQAFIPFDHYDPLSMTTTGTHDTEPLAMWWKNSPQEAIRLAHLLNIAYHPILSSNERFKILKASHQTTSKLHINPFQEYLALFPELVSSNLEEERINIPGTFLPTNWSYRFKRTIEEITSHEKFTSSMKLLSENS